MLNLPSKVMSTALLMFSVCGPAWSYSCTEVGTLNATATSNAILAPGQCLVSPNKKTLAVMQGDGNLVVYPANPLGIAGPAMWDTKTYGNPGAHLELQQDGNLVIYGTRHDVKWNSCTVQPQFGNFFLQLQDDTNLVAYAGTGPTNPGGAVWSWMIGPSCAAPSGGGCTWSWVPSGANVISFQCK